MGTLLVVLQITLLLFAWGVRHPTHLGRRIWQCACGGIPTCGCIRCFGRLDLGAQPDRKLQHPSRSKA